MWKIVVFGFKIKKKLQNLECYTKQQWWIGYYFQPPIFAFFSRFCLANGIVDCTINSKQFIYGWYGNNKEKKKKLKIDRERETISIALFLSTHFLFDTHNSVRFVCL